MDQGLKRYLVDVYAGVYSKRALALLYRDHGREMRFTDETLTKYRSDEELKRLEDRIKGETETLAKELVDELESHGFDTLSDFEQTDKQSQLKAILDGYDKRVVMTLG
jgi:hypothetical protein